MSRLGKTLCRCFFYLMTSDVLWPRDRLAQEPSPCTKARVSQAAVPVTLLRRDQRLLAPDIYNLTGTSAQQGIGATVCCVIGYLISVVLPL